MTHHAAHLLPLLVALGLVAGAASRAVRSTARGRAAQLVSAAALMAAAAVHVVAAKEHAGAGRVFFIAVTVVQSLLAVAALQHPDRRTSGLVALSSAGLLGLWLESRTIGIGYGVESVGTADLLAGGLELVALAAAAWLTAGGSRRTALTGEVAAWGLIVVAGTLALSA